LLGNWAFGFGGILAAILIFNPLLFSHRLNPILSHLNLLLLIFAVFCSKKSFYAYIISCFSLTLPSIAHSQTENNPPSQSLDIPQETIDNSPVLQRWLKEVPDVLEDINNDPAFVTRLRLGYSLFPSTNNLSGITVGIEDLFLDRTGLTFSADYSSDLEGDRTSVGGSFNYYLLPLGSYINIAPVVGYRYLSTGTFATNGINLGVKLIFSLSRNGAADISLSQVFISPTGDEEVGITTLSVGYAITPHLRLATDIQQENSPQAQDSRVGILLEWIP
jgi:hypothetical protein